MKRKYTQAERAQFQVEALSRAETGQSFANYPAIYEGFTARGIAESEIEPRVNVFTYAAWQAKGRQVRRGEKGVKIVTFIVTDDEGETRKFAHTSVVFHVSQTDAIEAKRAA
jgi:hypothetical protein